MIVVIGAPSVRLDPDTGRGRAAGLAARIAIATSAAGGVVQLAGILGDDPAGDEVLLDLGRTGVGHLAVLRQPSRPTPLAPALDARPVDPEDAAGRLVAGEPTGRTHLLASRPERAVARPALDSLDTALCLSYLRDQSVIVAAEPFDPAGALAVAAAAAYAGAALVAVVAPGVPIPDCWSAATVLEAPLDDPDDDFARLVGRFAIGLDTGDEASVAFEAALAAQGWQAAGRA